MTREEEIYNAMGDAEWKHIDGTKDIELFDMGFKEGAQWADQHPHWISVKDELPEACVTVLTTTQHGTQSVGCYEDGWWLANSPNLVRMGSITHWMPLPAPPEHFADVSKKTSSSSEIPTNLKGGEK